MFLLQNLIRQPYLSWWWHTQADAARPFHCWPFNWRRLPALPTFSRDFNQEQPAGRGDLEEKSPLAEGCNPMTDRLKASGAARTRLENYVRGPARDARSRSRSLARRRLGLRRHSGSDKRFLWNVLESERCQQQENWVAWEPAI